jgi:carboxylesterase
MKDLAVDTRPYDLAPQGEASGAAVLCIHGLTGTPYEVRPLAETLAARGMRARGPLLPGHGGSPDELSRVSYTDWVECVQGEVAELRSEHERVFVCGLSLGGLLTLWLAANESVEAAAAIGTPLRFRGAVPLAVALGRFVRPMLSKEGGSDIRDPAARERHPSMSAMPTASVHQLIRLQRRVRRALRSLRTPLLVAHGALDRTAHPSNLEAIAGAVSSARVERLVLAESAHIVPVDVDGPQLCDAIGDFFESTSEHERRD